MDPTQLDGKAFMRHVLRLGSGLLALCSLADVAREALTAGLWRASSFLGSVYCWTVAAYAGTRQWEKWNDPQAQEAYGGHWYMHAWFLFPALLWLAGLAGLAEPSFPGAIVDDYRWVLAAFAGGKALGRFRAAKDGTIPPAGQTLTPEQTAQRHTLRLGAQLLGVVCLADAALEMFTLGKWHFAPGLYQCYALTLAAQVATRQWEKWTDPLDQDAHWGGWYVAAWLLLAAFCRVLQFMGYLVVWPQNMSFAIGTVLSVFAGTKVSVALRDAKIKEGWGAAPAPPAKPADPLPEKEQEPAKKADEPAKRDEPGPAKKTPEEPRAPAGPKDVKRKVDPGNVNPQYIDAAERLDHFTNEDMAKELGCSTKAAGGIIGVLIRAGLVVDEGHGWFRWIG